MLLALIVLGAWFGFDRVGVIPRVPVMPMASTLPAPCPAASVTRENGDEIALPFDGRLGVGTNELLRIPACATGTLRFTVHGTSAVGQGPRLLVSHANTLLFDAEITETRTVAIHVSSPGWIALAFVNDHHQPPEDRNLFVTALDFEHDDLPDAEAVRSP